MMTDGRLAGRRVLVLGASAGIGRVIAQRLGAAGAHVALAARRREVCEEAAAEIDGTAIGLACDVTDEEQCRQVVEDAVAGLGGLDDVVYSTGAISVVALETADAEWWRTTFERISSARGVSKCDTAPSAAVWTAGLVSKIS